MIAQLISQLIFNAWYWPIVVDRELKLDFLSKIKCFVMVCREYLNVIFISKGNE